MTSPAYESATRSLFATCPALSVPSWIPKLYSTSHPSLFAVFGRSGASATAACGTAAFLPADDVRMRIRCRDERERTRRRSIATFPVIGGVEPRVFHSPGEAEFWRAAVRRQTNHKPSPDRESSLLEGIGEDERGLGAGLGVDDAVASAMKAVCNADVIAWASFADDSISRT